MTRASNSYTATPTTTASLYNGFHGKISTSLQAVLTKTSDTGQFVPGTTNGSGVYGTVYEVYAFTDSLQATKPVFVRVDYIGNTYYDLLVSVGTGTDGAGNLTGVIYSPQSLGAGGPGNSSNSNTIVRNCYTSSDGSYLSLLTNVTAATAAVPPALDNLGAIVVERTRDADGTPNGNGITVHRWRAYFDLYWTGQTAAQQLVQSTYQGAVARSFDTQAPQFGHDLDYMALLPHRSQTNSWMNGTTVNSYPVYGWTAAGQIQGASKALMLSMAGDWAAPKSATTISHYGTPMTWLPMGQYVPMPLSATAPSFAYPLSSANAGYVPVASMRGNILGPVFRWE